MPTYSGRPIAVAFSPVQPAYYNIMATWTSRSNVGDVQRASADKTRCRETNNGVFITYTVGAYENVTLQYYTE